MTKENKKTHIEQIISNPLNPNIHLKYSKFLHGIGLDFLALAEYKASIYLGVDRNTEYETQLKVKLPDLLELDYNVYFRLKSLTNKLNSLKTSNENISVLDVAGGNGQLASFLDDSLFDYCLAEAQHNGLDGKILPFKENSFDYVVASHVFEHIPQKDRDLFVNNMLKIASKDIILINSFHIEGTFEKERMELALEIINQQGIQEHLDCGLPDLEELKVFANKYNKNIEITPNGSGMTAMAYMYLEHYANMAGKRV